MGQRGQARHIAARFKRVDADDEERRRKPRDMIVIDLASGPSVLENEPSPGRPDVVRSDADAELADLAAVERGTTRNLVASWKSKEHERPSCQARTSFESLLPSPPLRYYDARRHIVTLCVCPLH